MKNAFNSSLIKGLPLVLLSGCATTSSDTRDAVDNIIYSEDSPKVINISDSNLPDLGDLTIKKEHHIDTNVSISKSGNTKGTSKYNYSDNIQINLGLEGNLNTETDHDFRATVEGKILLNAINSGIYFSVQRGMEFQKLIATVVTGYEGGKVTLSVSQLNKMMSANFSGNEKIYEKQMSQFAVGAEVSYDLGKILREIRFGVNYYSVDNVDFGKVGEKIINNSDQFDLSYRMGGIDGGKKIEVGGKIDFEALKNKWKITVGGGIEGTRYNDFYSIEGTSNLTGYGEVSTEIQWNDHNNISGYYKRNQNLETYGAELTHIFPNGLSTFLKVSNTKSLQGVKDNIQASVGMKFAFGGGDNDKSPPLFKNITNNKLTLPDIQHKSGINTDNIQVSKKVESLKHIAHVNKSNLPLGTEVSGFNGNIILSSLNSFSNFTSVTLDGVNTSSDAFTIGNGQIFIDIYKLSVGTYVLVTDATPANIITMVVKEGSVIVDSITVEEEVLVTDSITTFQTPTLTSKTDTTINGTVGGFGDGDGIRNVTVTLYSDAGLTTVVGTNKFGNFTGLTQNTPYYLAATGEAKNGITGLWEAKKSSALSVTTNVTVVSDSTPNAFTFTDATNQSLSTVVESDTITVGGINTSSVISISTGEYNINGGAFTSSNGTVVSGDIVKVRHTTSGTNSTTTNSTLTIGGVSDTFSTTTEAVASDITAPVLSSTNKPFVTTVGTALTLETVTATDDVDGTISVVETGTVDFNNAGVYDIVYTATDLSGNISSITHTYTVNAAITITFGADTEVSDGAVLVFGSDTSIDVSYTNVKAGAVFSLIVADGGTDFTIDSSGIISFTGDRGGGEIVLTVGVQNPGELMVSGDVTVSLLNNF